MKTLLLNSHVKNINDLKFELTTRDKPKISANECLVKVASCGINPSDALATTGYFHHAKTPRIPGRDFAGTVVEGPTQLIGKKIWGSGGAAGISFDGSHAEFIIVPVTAIAEVPNNLDLNIAGAQPLPYVTAYYSLVTRARIQAGETVLVVGALGQVGKAAMSICTWQKAQAIALVRGKEQLQRAQDYGWRAINSDDKNLTEQVLAANNNQRINIIFNTVGNIYWSVYKETLAEFGRIVTIGARENTREAMINLFELYRANQDLIGVNTVSFDYTQNAQFLNEMKSGFESKQLLPLELAEEIYTLENAELAYQRVMQGSNGARVVICF